MNDAQQPVVSVVTPVYNGAATLGSTISGVLSQTHSRIEMIVVDDGSDDATQAICEAYGPLIRYIKVKNGGSSAARNRALAEASGDFIAFCDADDVLLPPYVEASLAVYRKSGSGRRIVMNDALLVSSNGIAHGRHLIGSSYPPPAKQRLAQLQKNFVPILSLFPRELYEEIGGFDEDLEYSEDWEFWLRAVLAGWEVVYQRLPHALYRLTPDSKSTHSSLVAWENRIMASVAERYAGQFTAKERDFLDRRLRTNPLRKIDKDAGRALREGNYAEARQLYRQLAELSTTDPRVRLRSLALAFAPGTMPLWRRRLRRIDAALGGRNADQSMDYEKEETA